MGVVIERARSSGEKGAKAVTDRRQGMCHQTVPDQQKARLSVLAFAHESEGAHTPFCTMCICMPKCWPDQLRHGAGEANCSSGCRPKFSTIGNVSAVIAAQIKQTGKNWPFNWHIDFAK